MSLAKYNLSTSRNNFKVTWLCVLSSLWTVRSTRIGFLNVDYVASCCVSTVQSCIEVMVMAELYVLCSVSGRRLVTSAQAFPSSRRKGIVAVFLGSREDNSRRPLRHIDTGWYFKAFLDWDEARWTAPYTPSTAGQLAGTNMIYSLCLFTWYLQSVSLISIYVCLWEMFGNFSFQ